MTDIDLKLGDDCRLDLEVPGIPSVEPGTFVTLSAAPYRADPDDPASLWAECEYGDSLTPEWEELPLYALTPLCAACTNPAAGRISGELRCGPCIAWESTDDAA